MKTLIFTFLVLITTYSSASCEFYDSANLPAIGLSDGLYLSLKTEQVCPGNVQELKAVLHKDGLTTLPSMVANRGIHNPSRGSFSFFESVTGRSPKFTAPLNPGDFFFGHFTTAKSGLLDLDQGHQKGSLMIELIVWDFKKGYFNFYELIGTGAGSRWFYRGDSKDAFLDNKFLKRQSNPQSPKFGRIMRCSACHNSGGPIMKELEFPHNDWWSAQRPLPFGTNKPSVAVQKEVAKLLDASEFSSNVRKGISRLEASASFKNFKKSLTLQEQLRPLFCTTEINIVSSEKPLSETGATVSSKSAFWVSRFLNSSPVSVRTEHYLAAARTLNLKFPESQGVDADHPWLAPVKGYADDLAVSTLMKEGLIDVEFVSDVLAVDFKRPLFSKERCALLSLVPLQRTNWQQAFLTNLGQASGPGAKKLLDNIMNPQKIRTHHQKEAMLYIEGLQHLAGTQEGVTQLLGVLDGTRTAVFEDEISKNPLGQILEPGFRVIFPSGVH
ncbi:MAG TPA: hypothetical protein VNJ01_17985 [Bacteriovoracaceae bacterium]|nr:hypothetical protein [Bacteriovoracaceae bacterium]